MFSKSETKFLRRVDVRLTAYYSLCVLATGVILGAFLYYRLSHKLTRDVEGVLEDTGKDILSFLDPATGDPDPVIRHLHNEVRATKHYRLSGRLLSADGRVLGVSDYFFDYAYPVRTDAFQQALAGRPVHEAIRVPLHRYTYHLLTTPAVVNGQTRYVLQLAIYGKPVRKTLRYFMVALLAGALPILLVLSLGVGGYIARRSLTPIHEMDTALRRITAARLQERIPRSHSGDELDQLAGTLNQMLERLEDSFRRSAEFSANAAHELRTPVATLRSAAELMVKGPHRASECHETAQRILVHCDRMSRMINDLLLLHRIECNPQEIQFAPVRLSALLKEIAAAFAEVAQLKAITLELRADTEGTVFGNEPMLRRLFSNLLDNALRYTEKQGRVGVQLSADDNAATVQVRDTGVGIAAADQPRVFDRFWRADPSRSRETGGAGLGLSIAQSLAELHGGVILVESELGKGACFTVRLPARRSPSPDAARATSSSTSSPP